MFLLIFVLYFMCLMKKHVPVQGMGHANFFLNFSKILNAMAYIWAFYPIVWVLDYGSNHLCVYKSEIIYGIMDLVLVIGVGWRVVTARRHHIAELFYSASEHEDVGRGCCKKMCCL